MTTITPIITIPHRLILTASLSLTVMLVLAGCQLQAHSKLTTKPILADNHASIHNHSYNSIPTSIASKTNPQTLTQQAMHIQRALATGDYASITTDIHPTRGVRFSMYAFIQPQSDKVFSRAQFAQYLDESKVNFTWGTLDGTGKPLVTPLPEYLKIWVTAQKFNESIAVIKDSTPSINEFASSGNTINNIDKIYQYSEVVEFYYNGTQAYSGMDWRALRLVFDTYQGRRYLIAIVNDQWTT